MSDKKTIRICCEGANTVQLDALIPLQGALKTLSDESYRKLKLSIDDLGFSFPVHAWRDKKKIYILDAHQRVVTLKRMRDEEGYKIPPLPVAWISATSKKEAALKILAATSQYGEMTPDGLFGFINDFQLDSKVFEDKFQFPEIDLSDFQKAFFGEKKTVSFEAGDASPGGEPDQFIISIHCKDEKELERLHEEFKKRGLDCKLIM